MKSRESWFARHPSAVKVIAVIAVVAVAGLAYVFYVDEGGNEDRDSDGDGLTDRIEEKHGLDPNDPTDAEEDWDNDLVSNKDEILYHTGAINDPMKPWGGKDMDDDCVIRYIEIQNNLNPGSKYSYGNLHDLLRLYGYTQKIPNNISFQDMKENPEDFEPRYWTFYDGGLTGYNSRKMKFVDISLEDPIFQYYADQVHIKWEDSEEYGEKGTLMLGDEKLYQDSERYNTSKPLVPPSYYLTHGRRGNCVESSVANDCISQYKGYPSTLVSAVGGHMLGEVKIGNTIYAIGYNIIVPRIYNTGEKLESYDPNWYTNGTDRHM